MASFRFGSNNKHECEIENTFFGHENYYVNNKLVKSLWNFKRKSVVKFIAEGHKIEIQFKSDLLGIQGTVFVDGELITDDLFTKYNEMMMNDTFDNNRWAPTIVMKTDVFQRTKPKGTIVQNALYHMTIGLTLCWGLFVIWLIDHFINTIYIWDNKFYGLVFIFLIIIACFCGFSFFNNSRKPKNSFLGYTVLVLTFVFIIKSFLDFYAPNLISETMKVAGIVSVFMMIAWAIVPYIDEADYVPIVISIMLVIAIELLQFRFLKMDRSKLDFFISLIFCGYINFYWARANHIPKTIDNAIDSCGAIYSDIYNIFFRLIKIIGTSSNSNDDEPLVSYWPNGNKKLEIVMKNNKAEGIGTFWFENGIKESEIEYKDDKYNGNAIYWDEKGKKVSESQFKDDQLNGKEIHYDGNGNKWMEYEFKDDKKNGIAKRWNEKGDLIALREFKNDLINGNEINWYNNGVKSSEGEFIDGKLNGKFEEWYENGIKKSSGVYKDNKLNGIETRWYENGVKKSELEFKNGKLNGKGTKWYIDGEKKLEIEYKDGEMIKDYIGINIGDGPFIQFWPNKIKRLECAYKNGMLHGKFEEWYEYGNKKAQIEFYEGKPNGKFESWYENGRIKKISEFKNGKPHGNFELCHENGNIKIKAQYLNGMLNGKQEIWYANGNKKSVSELKENKLNGKSEIWYENGRKKSESEYKDHNLNGKFTVWNEKGDLIIEENYRENLKHGKCMEWNEKGKKISDKEFRDNEMVKDYLDNK